MSPARSPTARSTWCRSSDGRWCRSSDGEDGERRSRGEYGQLLVAGSSGDVPLAAVLRAESAGVPRQRRGPGGKRRAGGLRRGAAGGAGCGAQHARDAQLRLRPAGDQSGSGGLAGRAPGLEPAERQDHAAPGRRAGGDRHHQAQGAARRQHDPGPDDDRLPGRPGRSLQPGRDDRRRHRAEDREGLGQAARRHLPRLPRDEPVGRQAGRHPLPRHLPGHDLQSGPAAAGGADGAEGPLDVERLPDHGQEGGASSGRVGAGPELELRLLGHVGRVERRAAARRRTIAA